mgnify:CR=1 FL=1
MVHKYDFLVIGSGLAGMSFALKVAHKGKVELIALAHSRFAAEEEDQFTDDVGVWCAAVK